MPKGIYDRTEKTKQKMRDNHADVKGKNNPNWRGGKPLCVNCGKKITRGLKHCHSCAVKGERNPSWKGGKETLKRYCKICKKLLEKKSCYRSKTSICKECWGEKGGHIGKSNPNWKGGYSVVKKYCYDCGKICSYTAKRCKSCAVKMELHHNWQGGISFEPYPLGWTKTFKEQIRHRDGYKCQLCGMPEIETGRRLDVHHIDYDKSNLNPDNLLSLCVGCHMKTNRKRDYWMRYFNEKKEVEIY